MTGRRHGVLVMSRYPLLESELLVLAPGGEPFVRARLGVDGSPVELIGVHAAWPLGAENSRIRNQELAALSAMALSAPKPLVIAGDLNISPHSPHFQALLAGGGLRSASAERRWAPTWPTFFLAAGIEIDHVLLSGPIAARRFETGSAVGSDHLPIVVDLVF
jgi:endonuclease/exonuclease/phosphatase (EEP) superfamily protein YafD